MHHQGFTPRRRIRLADAQNSQGLPFYPPPPRTHLRVGGWGRGGATVLNLAYLKPCIFSGFASCTDMNWPWTKALNGHLSHLDAVESAIRARLDLVDTELASIDTERVLEGYRLMGAEIVKLQTRLGLVEADQEALTKSNKDMLLAIAEGIERTDRAERRVKATIRRAQTELKGRGFEDPGIEAEAQEFRETNGERSEPGGLLPVPADVETPSSIKGVSLEALHSIRRL